LVRTKIGQLTLLARSIILIVLARKQAYFSCAVNIPSSTLQDFLGISLVSAALNGLSLMLVEKCLLMETPGLG